MVILGASFDSPERNAAFREKYGYPFHLLCDTTREMGLAYGVCTKDTAKMADRKTFLIDTEGKLAAHYDKVDPFKHPEAVLLDLGGQVSGKKRGFFAKLFGR